MRHILASLVGGTLEWFDFAIYGCLYSLISTVFIPASLPHAVASFMAGLAVMTLLARPLGGMLFAHWADRRGRRKAYVWCLLVMALTSLAIACLPTYQAIGLLAPILLLLFRFIQSLSIGGNTPVLTTYISELMPAKQRSYYGSLVIVASLLGVILALLVVLGLMWELSGEQLERWGWRIPFMLTFVSVVFSAYLRMRLPETYAFQRMRRIHLIFRFPLLQLLREHKRSMVKLSLLSLCGVVAYSAYNVLLFNYFWQQVPLTLTQVFALLVVTNSVLAMLIPVGGWLANRLGKHKLFMAATVLLMILVVPLSLQAKLTSITQMLLLQGLFAVVLALYLAPLPAMMIENVKSSSVRCSAFALAYNMSFFLIALCIPFVWGLLKIHHDVTLLLNAGLFVTALLACITSFFLKDTTGKMLV